MILIDLAAFQNDYHDSTLRAADVAERYHLDEGSLSEFAQSHGIKSRKQLGIRYRSEKHRPVNEDGLTLGSGGCRPQCPGWVACRRHMGREAPLCEVLSYLDENPALVDTEPVYSGGVALGVRLYLLEDEL